MDDLISRQMAIKDAESWVAVDEYEKHLQKNVVGWLKEFPSAEYGTNLAEVGTDLISRRAAIDAAIEAADDWDGGCNIGRQKRIEKYIRQLPSAEPQERTGRWIETEGLEEEIRCTMCTNPMRSDRGCDGSCKYDEKLYKQIMLIIKDRID